MPPTQHTRTHRQPPSSPTSPTARRHEVPAGFRPSPRPKHRIAEMSLRELRDLHSLNTKVLASPGASSSTYSQRISAEQAAIEARLLEVDGMETINNGLKNTRIQGESDMVIDAPPEPPTSRTLEAKQRALSRFAPVNGFTPPGSLSLQEAIDLERQAHVQDMERQKRLLEKKQRLGMPIKGEILSRKEREARIWAFMNHKPTESDLEDDDDDEDDEDEDPSSWFEDDQDDGRKGQDIIEPDAEDFADIIRVDDSRFEYGPSFYGARDDGD